MAKNRSNTDQPAGIKATFTQYVGAAKTYATERSELLVGIGVVAALVIIVAVVAIVASNSTPRIVYQPAAACSLLTSAEAKELLGDGTLSTINTPPKQSENIATSNCGYSDSNPNQDAMRVAALAVRSGINDDGTAQNKSDFATAKSSGNDIDIVPEIGDDAYYDKKRGQLNVLRGHDWIILSYGIGSAPESNTVDQAVALARKVLR